MQKIDVTISIVSYNSENVLKNCIDSIIKSTENTCLEIIVVDNASEDGSASLVKELFPDVILIENKENVGFGTAHNQSFRLSGGRYFLILNPDTVVFHRAIDTMVKFMDSHNDAGAVGCRIWWDDAKNFIFPDLKIHALKTALFQFTPFSQYFPNSTLFKKYLSSAYRIWRSTEPSEVEGVTGGIILVRKEAFGSVGMFDEHFFLFFEEHDLLRRLKHAGWKIYYLPNAEIQHLFEESFRNSSIDIGKIFKKSALYYYEKHYKKAGYYFITSLIKLNNFITKAEENFKTLSSYLKRDYTTACPGNNSKLYVEWPAHTNAVEYIIEISFSPRFCDRAGMYVKGKSFTLKSSILTRLPDNTGFLRILPVHGDKSVGKVIKVLKITERGKETDI